MTRGQTELDSPRKENGTGTLAARLKKCEAVNTQKGVWHIPLLFRE
jgi:hypothetical protein